MKGFKTVLNFRDSISSVIRLTESDNVNKLNLVTGMLFRSARLDGISPLELKNLMDTYKIVTIVDLRTELEQSSSDELQAAYPLSLIKDTSLPEIVNKKNLNAESPDSTLPQKVEQVSYQKNIPDGNATTSVLRQTYRINLIGKIYKSKAVWSRCSFLTKIKVIFYYVFGMKNKATKLVAHRILAPRGLLGTYTDMIDFCQVELLKVLNVILLELHKGPILIHCSHGKDRTGLVTALLLSILNVPIGPIVKDYSTTTTMLASNIDQVEKEFVVTGLPAYFAKSDPETMEALLNYILENYGSVPKYLDKIGFNYEKQEAIRKILVLET